MERRWRKERHRSVPSPSALFRYSEASMILGRDEAVHGQSLHSCGERRLQGLRRVNQDLVAPSSNAILRGRYFGYRCHSGRTQKKDALFSYKGYKAYQPFNVWWAEQKVSSTREFRDGNVPAGYEQLRYSRGP